MPWGALSGARLVRGLKRVFWGRGGGVRAAVAQYLRYLQIHAIPKHTYIYMQIVVNSYSEVSVPKIDAYTYTYIQYLHIPTMQIPTNTYVDRY